MATTSGGYASGVANSTADTTTVPPLDPSLSQIQYPTAAAPTSQPSASSYQTLLHAIAQHYNIKASSGQDLEDLVLSRLSQEADRGGGSLRSNNNGTAQPKGKGYDFGSPPGPSRFTSTDFGQNELLDVGKNFLQSTSDVGSAIGDLVKGGGPTPGAQQGGGMAGGATRAGVPGGAQRPHPQEQQSGQEKTRNKGNSRLMQDKNSGKWFWVSEKNGEWVPDRNQGTAASRIPPAGSPGAPSDADQGSTQEGQANAKQVAAIATKLGLPVGTDLGGIADHLGINTAGTPQLPGGENNAPSIYSQFSKQLSDPKTKQAWTEALEKANLLDASQNNGTPDNAHIGAAFQLAMQGASQAKTDVRTYIADQGNAPQVGPDGKPIQQTSSELEAFVQGEAEKFGIHLSPFQVTTIANQYKGDAATNGVSGITDEVKNSVVQYYNPNDPLNPPGAANDMYMQVQAAALKYGIPFSPGDAANWVKLGIQNSAGDSYSIAAASKDVASMAEQHYQQQAMGLYPSLAGQIGAGMDVATLIQPYNNITAAYTGKSPQSLSNPGVDPTNPDYKFLQGATDPKTGQPTMMTMDAWKKTLMQDPQYGFSKTTGGKDLGSQFSSALLNEFGLLNTGSQTTPFSGYSGSPQGANT